MIKNNYVFGNHYFIKGLKLPDFQRSKDINDGGSTSQS